MEAIGLKRTLNEAKVNDNSVKVIFQYPGAERATKKSGKVMFVDEDSFTIDEIYDGEATYSYQYVVEITEVKE